MLGLFLYKAATDGKLDEVETALDAGAPMEWANPDKFGWTAIHAASDRGHKDVVAFLGSRGADVNAVSNEQYTALHQAASRRNPSVCATLLAFGADPAAKTKDGRTALDIARAEYCWDDADDKKRKAECVAWLEAAMR
jgi:ankyrin repeat protein